MNKLLLSALLILFSANLMAEANVDAKPANNTFLLNAPGTLTGTVKGESVKNAEEISKSSGTLLNSSNSGEPRFPPQQRMAQPARQYRYVEENDRKFRQFGQTSGQNNPWFEGRAQRYARPTQPMTSHPITNPWQLGGMPPMTGQTGMRSDYSSYPYSSRYNPDGYMTDSRLYPDYPDGIYRDNNPALLGMPGQSGFLPGFDGNNFPLPFSPFGLF